MINFTSWLTDEEVHNLKTTLYTRNKLEDYRHLTKEDVVAHLHSEDVFQPPHKRSIPKDVLKRKFRTIFVYETMDNFVLKLVNEYLNETFSHHISPKVFSYKKGLSTTIAVKDFQKKYDPEGLYLKIDLTNYFQSPSQKHIQDFVGKFGLMQEPFNRLWENKCVNPKTKEIMNENMGLLPGSAVSAFLSNAYLNSFDFLLSCHSEHYARYSDDFVVKVPNTQEETLCIITEHLKSLDLEVNEAKTRVFQPHTPVTFLGLNISEDGIKMTPEKMREMKDIVKDKAKQAQKQKGKDTGDKVIDFYKSLYSTLFRSFTKNIFQGGLIARYFEVGVDIEQLQELDFYILDQARFVASGKHNKGALKAGWDTARMEQCGFKSLILFYRVFSKSKLLCSYEMHRHLMGFQPIKPCKNLKDKEAVDILNLILQGSPSLQIDSQTLTINSVEPYTLMDHYGEFSEEEFFDLVRMTNAKELGNEEEVQCPKLKTFFNPLPKDRMEYYHYAARPVGEIQRVVEGLLFLWRSGRLDIPFSVNSQNMVIKDTPEIKFVSKGREVVA